MKLLGKKISFTKFKCDGTVSEEQLMAGLKQFAYREDSYAEVAMSFAPVNDPWETKFNIESVDATNSITAFLFRLDVKKIPGNLLQKEEADGIRVWKELNPDKEFISKSVKKEIKEKRKEKLLFEVKAVPSFTPVIFDISTGEGYLLTNSKSIIEKFFEVFRLIVDCNPKYVGVEGFDEDFLTWLWWRIGTNPNKEVGGTGVTVAVDDKVTTSDGEDSVSCKSEDSEECRISLLRGLKVAKVSLTFIGGESTFKLHLDGGMNVSGVMRGGAPEFTENEPVRYYDAKSDCDKAFYFVEALVKEYVDCNKKLPQQALESWARGDFCTRQFDDV